MVLTGGSQGGCDSLKKVNPFCFPGIPGVLSSVWKKSEGNMGWRGFCALLGMFVVRTLVHAEKIFNSVELKADF